MKLTRKHVKVRNSFVLATVPYPRLTARNTRYVRRLDPDSNYSFLFQTEPVQVRIQVHASIYLYAHLNGGKFLLAL